MFRKIVVRLIQLMVALFFTFCALSWFGSLLVLPLAVWFNLIDLLSVIGFNALFAAVISIPLVVAGLYYLHLIPQLSWTLFDIGMNVVHLGLANFQRLDNIARNDALAKAQSVQIEVREVNH